MLKYSVLMPFYNRIKEFGMALSSYQYWYGDRKDVEIVIGLDIKDTNGSDLVRLLTDNTSINVKIIRTGALDCFVPGPAFNVLARVATGNMLVITNPETVHLDNILDSIAANWPNPDSPDHPFYLSFACEAGIVGDYEQKFPKCEYEHYLWYQHSEHNNRMLHFCSAIAKDTYFRIGGFDEGYSLGIGYDDNDFIYKINSAGIPCRAVDSARVLHIEHDRSYNNSPEKTEINKQRFISKWGREP